MNGRGFSLQPFVTAGIPPHLRIIGNIARRSNALVIRYALFGYIDEVVIPALADVQARKHRLWEETCFELFIAVKNSPQYWEFNLSPAGHWNIYRFADYRQGMQEERAFNSLEFSVETQPDFLSLALELDLNRIMQSDQLLEIAISAVVKHKEGGVTLWALAHQGQEADFHRRDCFMVEL